jgi:hypothetical protein
MTRATALVCALASGSAGWACSEFETVGRLSPDAGVDSALAPGPDAPDEGSDGRTTLDECEPGDASNLDAATIAALTTGVGDNPLTWLYPYDGTVFPTGLQAPLLMWSGSSGDAVYVRLQSQSFEYRGCLTPTASGQLQLPQRAWELAQAVSGGAADPFTLALTVSTGGKIFGPSTERIVIANGALPGPVYYMTLGSTLGGEASTVGSAVIRVRPGNGAELVLGTAGCTGCHSLSADGSHLIANAASMGASFLVGASATPTPLLSPTPGGEYPALVPDGALYLATAHPSTGGGPRSYGAGASMTAVLYETATGVEVTGTGIPPSATVPSFAPDGTLLAFNDPAIDAGNGLAVMDFSESSRSAANYRVVYSNTSLYPGWPSFLPDGRGLVFSLGMASDFSGGGTGLGVITPGPLTDL